MLFLVDANKEVVRLDVSVQEVIVMQKFHSLNHLVSNHSDSFQRELPFAEGKQVLQARAQQIHHHSVIVTLHAEPMHIRNSN
jgi:hypothetical protein